MVIKREYPCPMSRHIPVIRCIGQGPEAFEEPSEIYRHKFLWAAEQYETTLISTFESPTLSQKQAIKVGQVLSFKPALSLLAHLYDNVVLTSSFFNKRRENNAVIAVGLLAAAGLCDVSPSSIRLTQEGKDLVDFLMSMGNEEISWQAKH